MSSQQMARRFRFGMFEADTATGELRKGGVRLRLQDQPFQVLIWLLERPGEVLTREELRQKLWPDGTFVDFDHSLNSIINKLREVLGDSAGNPRFIETLARRGYRFLAPVSVLDETPSGMLTAVPASSKAISDSLPFDSLLTRAQDLPPVPHGYVRFLFALIEVMYLSFYLAALARLTAAGDVLEQVFLLPSWTVIVLIVSAAIGIPVRLYLLAAVCFNVKNVSNKFLRIFPAVFLLDQLWALAPFLLVRQIGWGLALAATAALIYVPFAQRTLVLMRDRPHPGN
ncbi:MAG TPA: winged helix-turn-helix domain-containing protein [Terriglobales bacterium]|nr:winged helix-turn-helix domain-containing protein [Terriglobales bacterium]